ncbi:terpenoid synthase, partial [Martensiomyces pterosporus]
MATKTKGVVGQLGVLARGTAPGRSKLGPLGSLAMGATKGARSLESAAADAAVSTPAPLYDAIAELKRPISASNVQLLRGLDATYTSEAIGAESSKKLIDPKELVGSELSFITDNLSRLLESGHPMLSTVSRYYLSASSKHVRPMLIMLVAQATSVATKRQGGLSMFANQGDSEVDYSLIDRAVPQEIQSDIESQEVNQLIESATKDGHGGRPYSPHVKEGLTILPTHRRLAEITEMLHTSTLLHDDVIDRAETRRGLPAIQKVFGNKMAIFAGDFLLARACIALSRLRSHEVSELMMGALGDLVDGEFKQLKNLKNEDNPMAQPNEDAFEYYLEKTYLKTGSLIAKSC